MTILGASFIAIVLANVILWEKQPDAWFARNDALERKFAFE